MPDFEPAPPPSPQPTPPQPEVATPDAFGAGVFAQQAVNGEQAHAAALQLNEINLRNRYESDLTAGQVRLAQLREQAATTARQIQTDPNLSIPAYHDQVVAAFDKASGGVTDGVANPRIATQLRAQLGEMRAQVSQGASEWQAVQQAKSTVAGAGVLENTLAGQAYKAENPDEVAQLQLQYADWVHGLPGLTPDERTAAVTQAVQHFALNFGQGIVLANPVYARQLFDADWFEQHGVRGDALHTLERTIDVQNARLEAEKNAADKTAQQQILHNAEALTASIAQGGQPTLQDLHAARIAVEGIGGHEGLVADLQGAEAKLDVRARLGSAQPQMVAQAAQQLEQKVTALENAGNTVPLDLGARAKATRELADQLNAKANSAPWELAGARGIVPTPLDWNLPVSQLVNQLTQRNVQAKVLAGTLGPGYRPQPLQGPEAGQLAEILNTGAQPDKLRVLSAIAATEKLHPGSTAALMNQVQVSPEYRAAAGLLSSSNPAAPQIAGDMLTGSQVLHGVPGAVPQEKFTTQALKSLGLALGANVSALSGDPRMTGIVAMARNLYAADAAHKGTAASPTIDSAMVNKALNSALGGYVDGQGIKRGGLGNHNGAMVLPDGMSQQQFDHSVQYNLPTAVRSLGITSPPPLSYELFHFKSDAPPPLNFMSSAQFHATGDGRYKIWTGSGYLADKQGRQVIWDARTGKARF